MKLKFAFFFVISLFASNYLSAQDPFMTTWDVSANDTIVLPLQSGAYSFNFQWTLTTNASVQISGTHTNADGDFATTFVDAGIYELEIAGAFPHLKNYPKAKLLDVLQWGDILWGSMESMFDAWPGTDFTAVDTPDLSAVTNFRNLFRSAVNFNDDLNHWDVSNVSDFGNVFSGAHNFNGDITNWDVSSGTFFARMFIAARKFNQDISDWNMSSATNVERMFDGAEVFNQPIGRWDVSNVSKFKRMLAGMNAFDRYLGNWIFRPGADFSQFMSGTNSYDCQIWSATIIGWNEANPTTDSLAVGGPNAQFDTIAAAARDELLARGWSINGAALLGNCQPCALDTPLCESFELFPLGELTDNQVNCWTSQNSEVPQWTVNEGLTASPSTGPIGAVDGERYIYLETRFPTELGDQDMLTSPVIDISHMNTPRLSFFYHMFGEDIGSLIYEISDDWGQTFVPIDTIIGEQQSSEFDQWTLVTEDLTAFGSSVMVRFVGIAGLHSLGHIALDKIRIDESPVCGDFHSLRKTRIDPTSILVEWTPAGGQDSFIVSYGPAGILPGQGTVVNTTAASLLINDIPLNELITIHVEGFCGAINADEILSITTKIVENDICEGAIPIFCGDTIPGDLSFAVPSVPFASESCGDDTEIQIGLYYSFIGTGEKVNLFVDDGGDELVEPLVFTGTCANLGCFEDTDDYEFVSEPDSHYTIFLTAFNDESLPFEFSLSCDSCYQPRDVTLVNITPSTAEVVWKPGHFSTTYQIEFDTAGFALGTGQVVSGPAADGTATMGALDEDTAYEFYLFEICNGQPTNMIGPILFVTACTGPLLAPYCEGFDDDLIGDLNQSFRSCWRNEKTSNTEWSIEDNSTTSSNTGPSSPQVGNRYIYLETSASSTGESDTLTGPLIDLSNMDNPQLTFFTHMFGSNMGTLLWQVSDDMGQTFVTLDSLVGQQQDSSSAPWSFLVEDLNDFGDMIIIRFIGIRGNGFRSDMAIDEICIRENPCPVTRTVSGNQSDETFQASGNVVSDAKVVSGQVTYRFGEAALLNAGFEVVSGATFNTLLSNCEDD